MDVSVGIMVYNESRNLQNILDALKKQKTDQVRIKEIIVVDDGSIDNTSKILLKNKDPGLTIIKNKKRMGKWNCINKFIKKSKSGILVLESADNIPDENAVENLCRNFNDKRTGIVASRIIPLNNKEILFGRLIEILYDLHHKVSAEKTKFGELIAFRKVFEEIPETAVDEEEISAIISKKGFCSLYEPEAVVYNKGPETISDYVRQRRRIYCGHLQLKKRRHYTASTLDYRLLIKKLASYSKSKPDKIHLLSLLVLLETLTRFLGWMDYVKNKSHSVWKISQTTKSLDPEYKNTELVRI